MTRRIRSFDVSYAYPGVLGVPSSIIVTALSIRVTCNGQQVVCKDYGERING